MALIDLNDDGKLELVVQSTASEYCGSSGCATMIVQGINGKPALIFDGAMPDSLAITAQKKMADQFIASCESAPEELILDFDATDCPLYGKQEDRFFHGYSDSYCYLPLYVFFEGTCAIRKTNDTIR
jgi:hypothetical protein